MSRISRWPRGSSVPALAAALCLLVAPAAASGQLLCDGVLLDGSVAYAMRPAGGIDAIDLATGEVRWSSIAADKPLHLAGHVLVAQGDATAPGAVELAVLATRSGGRRHGMTVQLPADVWTRIDDGAGRAFRCHAGGKAHNLAFSWSESRGIDNRFVARAPALAELSGPVIAPAQAGSGHSGAARINLVFGIMMPVEAEQIPAGSLSAPRHQSGPILAEVESRQRLSADGAHVLASALTGNPGDWQKYLWSIYTSDGEPVGTMAHHTASAPFVVSGTTLVFREQPYSRLVDGTLVSQPLSLRGVDLASGQETWSRELRDTAYRGPFPP